MSSPEKHHLAQFILFFALVLIGTANFSYSVNSQTCNIPRYAHSPNHVTSWKISTEVIVQLDSSFSVTERDGIAAGNALWNNEAVFFNLRLWRDENHDGVSQSMELKSLRSLGIAVINLNYKDRGELIVSVISLGIVLRSKVFTERKSVAGHMMYF